MGRMIDRLRKSGEPHSVQNVQIVQKVNLPLPSEHSERIEQVCAINDEINERASIVRWEGSVPREWAYGYARMQTMPPPLDMPALRWQQMINDTGLFLDRWAMEVLAVGWTSLDLFGVHPKAPYRAIFYAGLVSLLNGRPVIAITADTAIIDCGKGVHHTYQRCQPKPGQIPLWELKNG